MNFGPHNHCAHSLGTSLFRLIGNQLVIHCLKAPQFLLAALISFRAGGRNWYNILVRSRATQNNGLPDIDENRTGALDALALTGSRPPRCTLLVRLLPLRTLPWCYDLRTRLGNHALGLGSRRLTLLLRLLIPFDLPLTCSVFRVMWLYFRNHRWRWWARKQRSDVLARYAPAALLWSELNIRHILEDV
jgi:hypothetical protein